jgi:hypothetical protein
MGSASRLKSDAQIILSNMSTHSEALAQAELLERISDDNLVRFFADELRRIEGGEDAAGLLPKKAMKRLVSMGVLRRKNS